MDLDKVLSSTELATLRDKEIERILACHEKDFFAILDITEDLKDAKKIYRKKSLLIHPDKSDHKKAPIAFDKLQKAYEMVTLEEESSEDPDTQRKIDEKKKLIEIYKYVGKDKPLDQIRKEVHNILIKEQEDDDKEKQIQKFKEAKEQEQMESIKQQRQLKKELDEKWEDQRESRVENWRNFVKKVEKKKKPKKKKVLA